MATNGAPWYRKWEFWIGAGSLIVAVISVAIAWSERHDRLRAEKGRADAERRLAEEQATVKDNLIIFVQEYQKHLSDMTIALTRYEQTKQREDLRRAQTSCRAMVAFVTKWRVVVAPLKNRMDGQIDALEKALDKGSTTALQAAVQVLEKNADSDLAALRAGVRELTAPSKPAVPESVPARLSTQRGAEPITLIIILIALLAISSLWTPFRGTTKGLFLAFPAALFGLWVISRSVISWEDTSATLLVIGLVCLTPSLASLGLWLRRRRR